MDWNVDWLGCHLWVVYFYIVKQLLMADFPSANADTLSASGPLDAPDLHT